MYGQGSLSFVLEYNKKEIFLSKYRIPTAKSHANKLNAIFQMDKLVFSIPSLTLHPSMKYIVCYQFNLYR